MNCKKCNKSVFDEPFVRMNKKGINGIFWCESCCKEHEPEFYQNEMEDRTQVEKDLIKICYEK